MNSPVSRFHDLDFIMFTGDFFHTYMDLSDPDVFLIMAFANDLFEMCEKYNIALLFLKGTPSHDWQQTKLFEELYKTKKYKFFFRYVDTVHAEYFPELGYSFLFVPDPGLTPRIEVERAVLEALDKAGLQQVDFAMMHGIVQYQVATIPTKAPTFDEAFYLPLVKISLHVGHVHIHSMFDRFFVAGSVERLAHGEEEAKGALLFQLKNGHLSYQFIENKRARIFKTIKITVESLEEVTAFLDKKMVRYPEGSFIKLVAKKGHLIFGALKKLKIRYWKYHLTADDLDKKERQHQRLIEDDIATVFVHETLAITPNNVISILMNQLSEKNLLTGPDRESLAGHLAGLL